MGSSFPRSLILHRRSDSLFPFPVSVLFGRCRYRHFERVSVNLAGFPARQCRFKHLPGVPVPSRCDGGAAPPTFRGDPSAGMSRFLDPGGLGDARLLRIPPFCLPRALQRRLHDILLFEAQSRTCSARCLRFTVRLPFLRKTRFQLLARLCLGEVDYSPGHFARFPC